MPIGIHEAVVVHLTTGTNTPPTTNQAQPGGHNPNQQHQPPTQLQRICFE